ncbi:MAG: hypothetical protein NTV34_06835 [Proteobacteria bacterium]|nr:hypothetical protein [Pseudomonadota bacterium]
MKLVDLFSKRVVATLALLGVIAGCRSVDDQTGALDSQPDVQNAKSELEVRCEVVRAMRLTADISITMEPKSGKRSALVEIAKNGETTRLNIPVALSVPSSTDRSQLTHSYKNSPKPGSDFSLVIASSLLDDGNYRAHVSALSIDKRKFSEFTIESTPDILAGLRHPCRWVSEPPTSLESK